MRVLRRVAAVCLVVVTVLLGACGSGSPTAQMPHVTAPDGKHELTKADVDAWLDGKIPDALNNGKIPGAVVTVVHDGQVVTNRGYEAYSWGVSEDESRDGLYCGFEGVVGAAVIGVQDTPGLEVRDDTFDEIVDTIDGRVVSFISVGEFTMGGFLHGVIIPNPM